MSDIEVIKIVFGILLSLGGAVLIFLAFILGYRYLVQEKRCTARTAGIVKRYSQTLGNGIFLPKVYYTVDGREYKVIGPRYKYYKTKTISTPVKGNSMEFEETAKQGLRVRRYTNSLISIKGNPMEILYPIGSEIDVYYDPNKPKLSYVLRYCNMKYIFWLMFLSGVGVLVFDLLILFLL